MNRLLVTALAVSVGCTTGGFDKLQDEATSDSQSQPEPGPRSEDFPFALANVELSAPQMGDNPVSMRFVALAINPPSLSTFEYRRDGTVEATNLPIPERHPQGPLGMAALGGDAGQVSGLVAISGRDGNIELYEARDGQIGPRHAKTLDTSTCLGGPYSGIGEAMLLAQTNALDANGMSNPAVDLIALGGGFMVLFTDIDAREGGNANPPECYVCNVNNYRGSSWRFTGITAFDDTRRGDEDDLEPIVAMTDDQGGRWETFNADQIRLDNGVTCFSATSQAALSVPDASDEFGFSMTVGDFDGDGFEGVAIADPLQDEILVIYGLDNGSPARMLSLEVPQSVRFGHAIAAGDIDGEPSIEDDVDELLVADLERDAEGVSRAGVVEVFNLRPDTPQQLRTLHDSSPIEGQVFGRSLTIAEFTKDEMQDESDDLVIVGAQFELFTYFAIEDAQDPRQ